MEQSGLFCQPGTAGGAAMANKGGRMQPEAYTRGDFYRGSALGRGEDAEEKSGGGLIAVACTDKSALPGRPASLHLPQPASLSC